jgi:hypothetical protein
MSKNRELGNIGNLSGTAGQNLVAQSDGSYALGTPSLSLDNYTISADANPAEDTNPSAAGALWLNQDTNQLYICMDATADANVWLGITFDEDPVSYTFQGSNYGYASGGWTYKTTIERFPFSSATTNASDVGDLTLGRSNAAAQASTEYGYTSGGFVNPGYTNVIDKFAFSSATTNAADSGDLTVGRYGPTGQSSSDYGYSSGGASPGPTPTIDRFPFASEGNASDVGDLTVGRRYSAGQSSSENGYVSGGQTPSIVNVIDRFPFSSETTNASDVGDLTSTRYILAGQSSSTDGFTSGGNGYTNVINKFPFASATTNAADHGDLSVVRGYVTGQSSTTYGYTTAGFSPPYSNVIDRFAYASNTTASDVGDTTVADYAKTGTQY